MAQAEDNFAQEAYLKASNTRERDEFGAAIAISGDTLVIGAPREDSGATGINGSQLDSSQPDSGAVYVFVRDGDSWRQEAYIKASNTERDDRFGSTVAIDINLLVVGAPKEDSGATGVGGSQSDNSVSNSGAAYVFERSNGRWRQQAYLKASNTGARDRFGTSVAVSGDTIVIGAPEEDSNSTGVDGNQDNNTSLDSGAAYVFARNDGKWKQQAYLKASNTGSSDNFGWSVDVDRDTLAVGAVFESSNATGINGDEDNNFEFQSGAVYVFDRVTSAWQQNAFVKAFNTEAGDNFGWSLDLARDELVVGAIGEDGSATGVNGAFNNLRQDAGAAYAYFRLDGAWFPWAYLKASNPDPFDFFGESVALDRDRLVVATADEDSASTGIDADDSNNAATGSGAAWSFNRVDGTWEPGNYIKASNIERNDLMGGTRSIGLSLGTLVLGARGEASKATGVDGDQADNSLTRAGAAYVFVDPAAVPISINAGHNDAWYNPDTDGQGFFIIVYPNIQQMFLAWFTYDVERPPDDATAILGDPGHRWITAQGHFEGDIADLDVVITRGGVFDSSEPVPKNSIEGSMVVKFEDCERGLVKYDIPDLGLSGEVPIQRIALDNVALCEALSQ